MNAYELAKAQQAYLSPTLEEIIKQQADRIAKLEKALKPIKCIVKDCENHKHEGGFTGDLCNPCYEFITTGKGIYSQAYRNTKTKPLSDEELNKAFDYYCETDEGVLRFNYELRDEWKKEQLSRWKEAFKKASEK